MPPLSMSNNNNLSVKGACTGCADHTNQFQVTANLLLHLLDGVTTWKSTWQSFSHLQAPRGKASNAYASWSPCTMPCVLYFQKVVPPDLDGKCCRCSRLRRPPEQQGVPHPESATQPSDGHAALPVCQTSWPSLAASLVPSACLRTSVLQHNSESACTNPVSSHAGVWHRAQASKDLSTARSMDSACDAKTLALTFAWCAHTCPQLTCPSSEGCWLHCLRNAFSRY